jgi:hypothetical protein
MSFPRNAFILSAALIFLQMTPARAQTIVETELFGPNTPPFDTVLTFDSYNGDLSHLMSIEVTWSMSITDGFLIIDNDALASANGTYDFGAQISINQGSTSVTLLDAALNPIFTNTNVTNSGTFNLEGNEGDGGNDFDSSGPDGISITGQPASSNGGANINDLFLAQFVSGLGGSAGATFDIAIQNQPYLNVTSNGGTEYAITPVKASGSVTVTYHLVPEPGTVLLTSLGLLFSLRRRRRG